MSRVSFTLGESLIQSAGQYGSKHAVFTIKEQHLSYKELDNKTDLLANFLQEHGIQKGDRVGIFTGKTLEQVISIYGIAKAGAVFVILNQRLKPDQIDHICRDCDIRVIFTDHIKIQLLKNKLLPNHPDIKVFLVPEFQAENKAPLPRVIGDDIASIIYTSGSTGRPKGVVLTHRNILDGADIVSRYLGITEKERILSLLAFNFDAGLNQLTSSIKEGAQIYLSDFIFEKDVFSHIQKFQITGLAGIPTIWIRLCNFKDSQSFDVSSLRYITNTGGKIPKAYVFKLADIFPKTDIFLMYGLTEAFRSTFLPPSLTKKIPESIGKAVPNVDIFILNKEGRICKPGEKGEIVHRGALISRGYWNNPKATEKVIKRVKLPGMLVEENVVFSGDEGYTDENGYIFFSERKDEMIKSSGYRISPTEIEEVIYQLPNIGGVVAFGIENAELGAKIKVVIQQNQCNAPDELIDLIKKHCMEKLPVYMQPALFEVVSSPFPTTTSDKFDRTRIKQLYGQS